MTKDEKEHHHFDVNHDQLFHEISPNVADKYIRPYFQSLFTGPCEAFRKVFVHPFRVTTYCYFKKYPRVPEIDQCLVDDYACIYEANQQHRRDYLVDYEIVDILREKFDLCTKWYKNDADLGLTKCSAFKEDWMEAKLNYFIKYGELSRKSEAKDVLMKQKHRMLFEKMHGDSVDLYRKMQPEEEKNMFEKIKEAFVPRFLPTEMK